MISLLNKLGRRMVSDRGEKLNNPRLFSCTAKRVLSVLFLLILGFSFLPTFDINVSAATATGKPVLLSQNFYEDSTGKYHWEFTVQASVFKPTSGSYTWTEVRYHMNDGSGREAVLPVDAIEHGWTDSTAKEVWYGHISFHTDYVGSQYFTVGVRDTFMGQIKQVALRTSSVVATEKNFKPIEECKTPGHIVYHLTPTAGGFSYSVWTGYGNGRPVTSFVIQYRPKGTSNWTSKTVATACMAEESGSVTGLVNGTTYEFRCVVTNEVGTLTSGNYEVTPGTPTAPRNLRTIPGNGSVTWTWDPPADLRGGTLQGYKILYGTGQNVLVANTGLVNSYTRTGITNGTNGTSGPVSNVRVAAIVEYGIGQYSANAYVCWVGSPQPVANACCIMHTA